MSGLDLFVYLGMPLLLVALSIPMLLERVPPNRWYGFRTPETLEDEALWYRANRYAARQMIGAAAILLVCNLVLLVFRTSFATGVGIVVSMAVLTVTTLVAFARAVAFLGRDHPTA